MSEVIIHRQFRGPPNSGNGGYVCGLLGRRLSGAWTVVLRARIPLDTVLMLEATKDEVRLVGADSTLIAQGTQALTSLPTIAHAPSLVQAHAAGARSPFIETPFHPPCFTCSSIRPEGDGLRILPGQMQGAAPGHVGCVWKPHAAFSDQDGQIPSEIVWSALDCPGSLAWIVKCGAGGGLLGTMTGEILRYPKCGQETIVTAWPIERHGRKFTAGVALFDASGDLLARGSQIWISQSDENER